MTTLKTDPTDYETAEALGVSERTRGPASAASLLAPTRAVSAEPPAPRREVDLPQWAILSSAVWVIVAVTYLLTVVLMGQGTGWTPGTIGGAVAGISAPLMVIWLVALLQMRALEVEAITAPVRRQLSSLLAPGASAETRVRRVTELLGTQADQLRQAASVALEDSSAAMTALTRQSHELRRLSAEAMLEIGRVGKTAEQTLKHLQDATAQLSTQSGTERERALALVTDLERHTRDVLQQVDALAGTYETKLSRLNDTATQIEGRAKSLVGLTEEIDTHIDGVAGTTLRDIDRLESVVAELGQRSAAIAHQLTRPVESLENAANTLDRNMRHSQDMLVSATGNLQKVGESTITRASALVTTLSDRLSSMELVGAKLVSVGASAQSETGRYVAQLEEAAARIREELDQGHARLRDTVGDFDAQASRALDRSEGIADTLRQGAATLADSLTTTTTTFDDLADNLEQRTIRFADAGKEAKVRLEDARIVLETSQDAFAAQLERLGQISQQLQQDIAAAGRNTDSLTDASALAQSRAQDLIRTSDTTRATLETIAGVLTGQQDHVRDLAGSLATQVEALTATLAGQEETLRQAATTAGTEGAKTRAALQQQVEAIAAATVDAAAKLDGLQARLDTGSTHLCTLANRLEDRLTDLEMDLSEQADSVTRATHTLQGEQEKLGSLATTAGATLDELRGRLGAAQQESVTAMDSVADRLAGLRGEVEKASALLRQSGDDVHATQGLLQEDSDKLAGRFADMLAHLETLTGGLESAGQTVAAQGQAASVLLEQAEQKLTAASGRVRDDSALAQQAVVDMAGELARQQQQLGDLHRAIETIAESLAARGASLRGDLTTTEEALAGAGQRLQHQSAATQATLEAVADRMESAAGSLQAEVRGSVSALNAATTAFVESTSDITAGADSSDQAIRQLRQDVAQLQQVLTALSDRSDTLATSLAQHAVQAELASGKLAGASGTVDQSAAQLATRMAELGDVAERQQRVIADMGTAVRTAQEALQASGERTQGDLQQALAQLATAGQQTDTVLGQMIDRLRQAGLAVGSEAGGAETLLSDIAETLRRTAEEFTHRIETAETQLAGARGDLADLGQQVGASVETLQHGMTSLRSEAEAARAGLAAEAGMVQTVSADVAAALRDLMTDMARLGESGTTHTARLTELTDTIKANLAQVDTSADSASAREKALLAALAEAEAAFGTLGGKVGATRNETEAATNDMIQRLETVAALLDRTAQDNDSRITHANTALRATADQLAQRAGEAETQIAGVQEALGHLDERLSRNTSGLQVSLATLSAQSDTVCADVVARAETVTSASASVTQALRELAADLERLGESGTRNADRLNALSDSVVDNLNRVELVTDNAEANERKLLAALDLARTSFGDLGHEVDGVRGVVSSLADHAAARLGEISTLFTQRLHEGDALVTGAVARLETTEAVVKATDQAVQRLETMGDRMDSVLARSDRAHTRLQDQAQQNERLVGGLSDLTELTTSNLERTTQRLAMLAQQAASDSSRMADVAGRIEQQQAAIRHAAEAAVAVMQSVEAQLHKSGAAGVNLIDAAEGRISDVMVAMTERLAALSQQNDGLMRQMHALVGNFSTAALTLRESGLGVGADLESATASLQTRAMDLTAAGQQFDRELKARLGSVDTTRTNMDRYFADFSQQLAELDTRTSSYLVDLERRSEDGFGRLRLGVDQLGNLPVLVTETQSMLTAQIDAARTEIAVLRQDLINLGRDLQEQVTDATGRSGLLLSNLQDVGTHSRLTAEQLDMASQQIVTTSESAWRNIRSAASEGLDGLSGLVNLLGHAQGQAGVVTDAVRAGIGDLLNRIDSLTQVVDTSLGRLASRYQDVVRDGAASFEQLTAGLETGATKLEGSAAVAREHFTQSVTMLANHQDAIALTSARLAEQMTAVRVQLEQLRDGFGGLDARLEHVGPVLASQQTRLDSFLAAVDRTLNQVTSLQAQTKDLAAEHLSLAAKVQDQEQTLVTVAGTLESKLGQIDSTMSGPVLARLQQAVEHAQTVDAHLGRLSGQTGRLDGALVAIRQSLVEDVKALENAEAGISGVAERTAMKLLEVGSALNATLAQLQKGGQISHAGLMQTNEETQRLVVRLEQVRALIKNMMGTISTDMSDWQFDLKKKLTALAGEIGEQLANVPKIAALPAPAPTRATPAAQTATTSTAAPAAAPPPPLPPSLPAALVRPPIGPQTPLKAPSSTQLAGEALNALAVDLYRLLHTESADLRKEMMPPLARRQPMTPEDARAYTHTLLEMKKEALRPVVRDLYARHAEFRQYVDRYLTRFEAQYDALVRSASGVAAGVMWRASEAGQLYTLMADALERKTASATAAV